MTEQIEQENDTKTDILYEESLEKTKDIID